jgi:hypothetical protein
MSTSNQKWTNEKLSLPSDIRRCFLGQPRLAPLSGGDNIYRLRTNRQDQCGTAIHESAWWFPRETYQRILSQAARTGLQITSCGRAGLAVPPRFNQDFDTLVICRLLRSGFCWRGQALPQPWSETIRFQLSGGFEQLWIPGLDPGDYRFEFFGNLVGRT